MRLFLFCLRQENVVKLNHPKHKQSVQQLIDQYSQYSPSALSLRQFLDFAQKSGDENRSFKWLRQEIPTRIANMIKEMNRLPDDLLKMPSTRQVTSWYRTSFEECVSFDRKTAGADYLASWLEILQGIVHRHRNVVETMAHGIIEWKDDCCSGGDRCDHDFVNQHQDKIQYFLDRFYTSRIGIRILINQHVLLFGEAPSASRTMYGSIESQCDVPAVVKDAYDVAAMLCEQNYLAAPTLDIQVHNAVDNDRTVDIIYVPSHLHHICFELFKNAMRATMETKTDGKAEVPAVRVCITKGRSDCAIKISDLGGGASRHTTRRWFEYLYSTAPRPPRSDQARVTPLAGYGYGLPIAKLYARYLGGDLDLQSMEGHGTDAFIYLPSLSTAAVETVPVYNASTTEQYKRTSLHGADWVVPNRKHGGTDFRNPFNGKSGPRRPNRT